MIASNSRLRTDNARFPERLTLCPCVCPHLRVRQDCCTRSVQRVSQFRSFWIPAFAGMTMGVCPHEGCHPRVGGDPGRHLATNFD